MRPWCAAMPFRRLAVSCCLAVMVLGVAGCSDGFKLPVWLEGVQPPAEAAAAPEPTIAPETETAALAPLPEPAPEGGVRIGLLVPLGGRGRAEGAALLDAAALALFELGQADVELLVRDTGGTPEGARRAAAELLEQGAGIVLGPLFADEVRAAAPLAQAKGVPLIAFSTNPAVAGENVYLLSFAPAQQVERVAAYALEQGYRRFAVIGAEGDYSRTVVAALQAMLPGTGAILAGAGFYAADASDAADVVRRISDYDARHRELLRQIAELETRKDEISLQALERLKTLDSLGEVPFDALFLADGGERLARVLPLLSYYDVDLAKVRLLGTGLWDDPATRREEALAGAWYAGTPPEARERFERRFAQTYGHAPLRLSTLAYDAVLLAGTLARPAPGFAAERIGLPSGFIGADGAFRFGTDGIAERALAVLEIRAGGETAVLSGAPAGFKTAGE